MFNTILAFWKNRLKVKKLMGLVNTYSKKKLEKKFNVSSLLSHFIESLIFFKTKKLLVVNSKKNLQNEDFLNKIIIFTLFIVFIFLFV